MIGENKMSKKIELDKYYTPDELAKYVVGQAEKVIGFDNITEYLEPSAGGGVFLDYLTTKPYQAYDIKPEDKRIKEQDFLSLNLEYKKGRCIIGNPPFGDRKNNLVKKFCKKSIELADYVVFILPIRQFKNTMTFYEFDLIHSEDLGVSLYSNIPIHCCLNIYKRPKGNKLNNKPKYELNQVDIKEHHRTNHPLLEDNFDYRICSFGASIGKECKPNTYCKELCFNIDNSIKDEVVNLLRNTDFKKEFPSISTPYIANWQIYKYIKEKLPKVS
jgi:predicted RNA methylase